MPQTRGPRNIRNRQYSAGGGSGGGGGGLAALVGAMMGAPTIEGVGDESLIDGGDNAEALVAAGEEGATGLPDYGQNSYNGVGSNIPLPTVTKPGFFQNLLTRGQAGMQSAALQNQLSLADYDSKLKQSLLTQRLKGDLGNRSALIDLQNKAHQEQIAKTGEMSIAEKQAAQNAALEEEAVKQGFPDFNTYKQILANPDLMTAGVRGLYSQREKQGYDNLETQAKTASILQGDIPYKQAQTAEINAALPTKPFISIRSGDAAIDPTTGRTLYNPAPQKEAPEVRGGPVSFNLPSYSGGSFAKVPGGVNGEVGGGVSRGVPPLLRRQQEPQLPQFPYPTPQPSSVQLPPGYEPYRAFIESQQGQQPVPNLNSTAQKAQPISPDIVAPQNYTNPLLEILRRRKIGVPQAFNPYSY
jgi:hypothetical protein